MALLAFTQLTEAEILLLENSKQVKEFLSPQEKFNRKFKNSGKKTKFHFKAIEHGEELVVFYGTGVEWKRFTNDFHGQREARSFAVDHFNSFPAEQTYGGYKFDFV